jgi:hypothetical protein
VSDIDTVVDMVDMADTVDMVDTAGDMVVDTVEWKWPAWEERRKCKDVATVDTEVDTAEAVATMEAVSTETATTETEWTVVTTTKPPLFHSVLVLKDEFMRWRSGEAALIFYLVALTRYFHTPW